MLHANGKHANPATESADHFGICFQPATRNVIFHLPELHNTSSICTCWLFDVVRISDRRYHSHLVRLVGVWFFTHCSLWKLAHCILSRLVLKNYHFFCNHTEEFAMSKVFSQLIVPLAVLVAIFLEPTNARLNSGQRHLTTCGDKQALYGRCCGVYLSACTCPIREYQGFGDFVVKYLWDSTCTKLEEKVAECSLTVGEVTAPVDSAMSTAGTP